MATSPDTPGVAAIAPAATAVSAEAPNARNAARELPLQFIGSAAEYFRIWIVNVCLTLLTLGIFSAWAKVRKKRYLYSHTLVDGTPFQYLGQPIPILKGRIIAAVLFGFWYVGTHFFVEWLPVILVVALVLAPWVLVRSAAFNARYSAYRNITFDFAGTYWGALGVLYGWGLLTLITFGICFSWWQQRLKRYLVTRTSFGGVNGEFSAKGHQFFVTYLIAGLAFSAIMIGLGAVVAGIVFLNKAIDSTAYLTGSLIVIYAMYVGVFAYIQASIANLVWNNTRLPPISFRSTLRTRDLLWLYVSNALAIVASAGMLIPWATIRMLKYRVAHFAVTSMGDIGDFRGSETSSVQAAGAEIGEFFDFDLSV
jgi:uncharacterized membrane protein YjgN (DUF898 family)